MSQFVHSSIDMYIIHTLRYARAVQDLVAPFGGQEVRRAFPEVSEPGACVLLRTRDCAPDIICRLADAKEAKSFHTCMSILRLSVSIAFSKDDAST